MKYRSTGLCSSIEKKELEGKQRQLPGNQHVTLSTAQFGFIHSIFSFFPLGALLSTLPSS